MKKKIICCTALLVVMWLCTSCNTQHDVSASADSTQTTEPKLLVINTDTGVGNFNDELIDAVGIHTKDGKVIYECLTNKDITMSYSDGTLSVSVPYIECSCTEDGGAE